MTKLFLVPTLAFLSIFGSVGPAAKGASPTKTAIAPSRHVSDAELERTIRTKLAKSKIGKDGFKAQVKSGVVTWEGNTNVIQHKGAATRMARTSGAVQVVNNIKISDAARQKASGNLSGARRAAVKVAN
jgi:hypothetical protein